MERGQKWLTVLLSKQLSKDVADMVTGLQIVTTSLLNIINRFVVDEDSSASSVDVKEQEVFDDQGV